MALSPTPILGGVAAEARCDKDTIAQYEQVGAQLAQRIPPGAQIYWKGDPSPTALLYLHRVKIYPPQLNGYFSFRATKDANQALRYGFWNGTLDIKWRNQADFILIRDNEFGTMEKLLTSKRFAELEQTAPVFLCSGMNTHIRIFKRK
jgi:hypothetical protein